MALEWTVLTYGTAAAAIVIIILLTMPGLDPLRKGLTAVTRKLLKPFLQIQCFCLFLLMYIFWTYATRPSCSGDSCTHSENLRHQNSQRITLLIASFLVLYWIVYNVSDPAVVIQPFHQRFHQRLDGRPGRLGWSNLAAQDYIFSWVVLSLCVSAYATFLCLYYAISCMHYAISIAIRFA